MRKTYGDLRLWLWTLLPAIHLLFVCLMLWRKDCMNAVTFARPYDHYTAFYLVPPDAFFDQCHAASAQTTILLFCSVIVYPLILRHCAKIGILSPFALRLHIAVFLAGVLLNCLLFDTIGSYWWWGFGGGDPS